MAVIRGQDYDIQLTLQDDGGSVIQPSTLDELYAYIVTVRRARTLARYSLNAQTGYNGITIVNDGNGIVKIIFFSSDTRVAPIGAFNVEIMARLSDADYEDSEQDIVCTLSDADWNVVESRIKAE